MSDDGHVSSPAWDKGREIAIRNFTGRFVVELLKSLNLSGYYPPDHPSIRDVSDAPLKLLGDLRQYCSEISFVSASGGGAGDVINVEGVFEEPAPLLELIHSSIGEVFARKFINYLDVNRLVSFSIKTDVDAAEFKLFIAAMIERKTRQEQGQALDLSFGEMLVKAGVHRVSVISVDEVVGAQRSLPWRVKLAMSRLAKDLNNLPIYSNAPAEQIQSVKTASIKDIIRPLRQVVFIRDLLVNSDIIQVYVQSLSSVDVEWEILLALHPSMVEEISWDLVRNLEKTGWGTSAQDTESASKLAPELAARALSRCAERLAELNMDHTYEFLSYLFERNILAFDRLPATVQRAMLARKWAGMYVQNPDACHQRLMQTVNPDETRTFFQTVGTMIPELVRLEKLDGVSVILQILIRHAGDTSVPHRRELAMEALHNIAVGETIPLLIPQAQNEDKALRLQPLQLLVALGERGWTALVQILCESNSSGVRHDILEIMTRLGHAAAPIILARLANQEQQWFVYRNLMLCLQNIKYEPAVADIKRFAAHMHPRVREQALIALHALSGKGAVNPLMTALSDQDAKVTRVAIGLLSKLQCREAPFLNRLGELLEPKEHGVPEELQESMQLAALGAIGQIGIFVVASGESVLVPVAELAGVAGRKGWKKLFRRKSDGVPERVRLLAIRTLGQIGLEEELDALEGYEAEAEPGFRPAIREAVSAIQARLAAHSG